MDTNSKRSEETDDEWVERMLTLSVGAKITPSIPEAGNLCVNKYDNKRACVYYADEDNVIIAFNEHDKKPYTMESFNKYWRVL